jgi:hypothetical protein
MTMALAAAAVAATACGESGPKAATPTHAEPVTTAPVAAAVTAPAPSAAVAATEVIAATGDLVATRPGGTRQRLGRIPSVILRSRQIVGSRPMGFAGDWPPSATPYVSASVSASGWVAVTGVVSEGFWFFHLGAPSREPRFVSVAGWPGGHMSRGTWNPAGTLFATVENGRNAVVIEPTRGFSRLKSADAPVGYLPTWTADGSGLLTGSEPPVCVTAAPIVSRSLGIVPIDGGPVTAAIPDLADGGNGVAAGGIWAHADTCRAASKGPEIVVVASGRPQSWVDSRDVAGGALVGFSFASTRPTLWALAVAPASSELRLYDVRGPHSVRLANTLEADGTVVGIMSVAADDSAVIVAVDDRTATIWRRTFALVPTDGGPVTTLKGEFSGFVPLSMLERLAAS